MDLSCCKCIKALNLFDDIFSTPCGHLFHKLCLDHWLQRSQTCPQCRFAFAKESVHKVFFNFKQCSTRVNEIGGLRGELHYSNERLKSKIKTETVIIKESKAKENATLKQIENNYKEAQDKLRTCRLQVDSLLEKLKLRKIETKKFDRMKDELDLIDFKLRLFEITHGVRDATVEITENTVNRETNAKSLALLLKQASHKRIYSDSSD